MNRPQIARSIPSWWFLTWTLLLGERRPASRAPHVAQDCDRGRGRCFGGRARTARIVELHAKICQAVTDACLCAQPQAGRQGGPAPPRPGLLACLLACLTERSDTAILYTGAAVDQVWGRWTEQLVNQWPVRNESRLAAAAAPARLPARGIRLPLLIPAAGHRLMRASAAALYAGGARWPAGTAAAYKPLGRVRFLAGWMS